MTINIADIFAEQMRDLEREHAISNVSSEDMTEQLKQSLKDMDAYLNGENPEYCDIEIKMYTAEP
ncbi:MAG: hypothetical protein CMH27_05935 [Micavibrio sp.]|nr:hypothetical protein [Micavibrio sp.]|tara:strand:+ start:1241 stop:1435 length:195 start_codon:yes stop_codon:yes gene_type:complete